MSKRKWAVGSFVPCSPRHHHCSPAHAAFVAAYHAERHRQWLLFETETALLPGDIKAWRENGGHLITLKDAMKAQSSRKERESYEYENRLEALEARSVSDSPIQPIRPSGKRNGNRVNERRPQSAVACVANLRSPDRLVT